MSPMQAASPGTGRVRAPVRLLVAGALRALGQPVLRIFDLNEPDVAERAAAHHRPRLPHQRVARVVMRQHENEPGSADLRGQIPRFIERGGQRLVADHVDAGFEKGADRRGVHVVRCHDGNRFDAVGPCGFRLRHNGEVVVAACGVEAQRQGRPGRLLGRGRQRSGDQLKMVVEPCRDAMHRADESTLAAADHAKPDASGRFWCACMAHVLRPSSRVLRAPRFRRRVCL